MTLIDKLLPEKLNASFSQTQKTIGNLPGMALSTTIASIKARTSGPVLIICADSFDVPVLESELFNLMPKVRLRVFSDWETLPYDQLSPHQDIISSRLELLSTIFSENGIVITSLPAIMSRLCPTDFIKKQSFVLKVSDTRDISALSADLSSHGYTKVSQVLEHGEFAVRGEILDLFPMGSDHPYRIDFLDDEVESISLFDVENQRSSEKVQEIRLLPAHEFPLDEEGIAVFRSNYRDAFPGANLKNHVIYQAISKGAIPAGIEYYLPLFFPKMSSFFDYLKDDFSIITIDSLKDKARDFDLEAHKRAEQIQGDPDHPPLAPEKLFLSPSELSDNLKRFPVINLIRRQLTEDETSKRGFNNAPFEKIPDIAFNRQEKDSHQKLIDFAEKFSKTGRIYLCATSEGRRQALREILPQPLVDMLGIAPASSFEDFLASDKKLMLTAAPFSEGCINTHAGLCFLTENELLGYKAVKQRERSHKSMISQDAVIKNLEQLTEGQVVVHVDHGIGRYRGLKILNIGGVRGEFLAIEYQNGDMLNIPITALNKVARYSGAENPPLSRLGNDSWSKKKQKAAEKARDVAAQLLDLYAQREASEGHSFKIDEKDYEIFASGFGYEETPDQASAIAATLNDLASNRPMNRLICGDVGFGKTEVAMRAAYVVAHCGYQVAILVPTTILAQQHYESFKDRFAGTPVIVEQLSRFKSAKEQNEAIKAMAEGRIDIVIGTHKLLSKAVKFKKLGLVIVDEEHRFGVKQKEKLKALCVNVDLLTLTATPIPRTLNMAMEGMRELSIIATPPEHRLSVKTFVAENSDTTTREAIMRELRRGGQVYYLHNDVATINQKAEQLMKLVPEAHIAIGHGQMNERELQKVMRDFYHQRFNLLLCSTIVENGLDVPTANTIIIDRADMLGLAQLHQIRGRVGRSHHQAYAYLFTPPIKLLNKDARLRLDAIASMEELGSGFILATHDLEIRGAGEILGEEQSGQIQSIGFSLYMEMLGAAVKALKSGREPSLNELTLNECDIDMHLPALLPETYIGDINTRLSFYKRLSRCENEEQFEDLKVELIDRFGFLPQYAENLFTVSKLKKLAGSLGIRRIYGDEEGGVIELEKDHKVDPNYLITLITTCRHNEYRISGQSNLRYNLKESPEKSRLELLHQLLMALKTHSAIHS